MLVLFIYYDFVRWLDPGFQVYTSCEKEKEMIFYLTLIKDYKFEVFVEVYYFKKKIKI